MPRRASLSAREAAARQAAFRTIAGGERPVYRILAPSDDSWSVLGCPWLSIDANDRRSAVETTRAAVAEWLGVSRDASDVETGWTDGYPTKPTPRRP
jgi:hypothetical protein